MAALELTTPGRRNKAVPPSGLPRDTMNFQGRAAELGRISAVLGAEGSGEPGVVVVCVVSGMGASARRRWRRGLRTGCAHRFPMGACSLI